MFKVYILIKGKHPVYAGMTTDILKRIKCHKRGGKDFDTYKVLYQNGDKKKAMLVESAYIDFIKEFSPISYNKQSSILSKILSFHN